MVEFSHWITRFLEQLRTLFDKLKNFLSGMMSCRRYLSNIDAFLDPISYISQQTCGGDVISVNQEGLSSAEARHLIMIAYFTL